MKLEKIHKNFIHNINNYEKSFKSQHWVFQKKKNRLI